jgi:hypothetical protein
MLDRRRVTLAAVVTLASLVLASASGLAAGPAVTMKGQVVCSGCWDEEPDRKKSPYGTQGDMECAARCEKKGVAAALAVEEGSAFKLYELEDGAFKRTGKGWLDYMGKRAELTGTVRTDKGKSILRVDALKVLPDAK